MFPNPLPYFLPTYLPGPFTTLGPGTFITDRLIRVNLPQEARLDPEYLAAIGYSIALRSDTPLPGEPVNVAAVLPPTGDELVLFPYIYLQTSRHTLGAYYELTITGLISNSGGAPLSLPPIAYAARVTKTMTMLKSMPSHFDMRDDSVIRNLLTAVSLEDDIIGGSRSDEFS